MKGESKTEFGGHSIGDRAQFRWTADKRIGIVKAFNRDAGTVFVQFDDGLKGIHWADLIAEEFIHD